MGRFLDILRDGEAANMESTELVASAKQAKNAKERLCASGELAELTCHSDFCTKAKANATKEESWAWIEERSAMMEIEGGLTREQADLRAFTLWFDTFAGGSSIRS